jgi:hypothetical protein
MLSRPFCLRTKSSINPVFFHKRKNFGKLSVCRRKMQKAEKDPKASKKTKNYTYNNCRIHGSILKLIDPMLSHGTIRFCRIRG